MYKIVTGAIGTGFDQRDGIEKMQSEIIEMIFDGWKPIGGVSLSTVINPETGKGLMVYAQAMIKELNDYLDEFQSWEE